MNIRESLPADKEAIRQVHLDAFGEDERELVSQLAVELLVDETAKPVVSLIAEECNEIVGHVVFSAVNLEGSALTAFILAPLAVKQKCQRRGVGTELITQGIKQLKTQGADIVLVYGDPDYYGRTGFLTEHGIKAPFELQYPHGWMAQALTEESLVNACGTAHCADSLSKREYW